jgi:hypothetical protein
VASAVSEDFGAGVATGPEASTEPAGVGGAPNTREVASIAGVPSVGKKL